MENLGVLDCWSHKSRHFIDKNNQQIIFIDKENNCSPYLHIHGYIEDIEIQHLDFDNKTILFSPYTLVGGYEHVSSGLPQL